VLLIHTLSDLQQIHPLTCAPLLNALVTFCKTELATENTDLLIVEQEINHNEKYLVQLMTILSNVLTTPEYIEPVDELRQWRRPRGLSLDMREEIDEAVVAQAQRTLQEALSPVVLFELIKLLLLRYMRLTSRELYLWDTDPEGFIDELLGELYQQRLGPCAEYLYMVTLRNAPSTVIRQLVDLIQNTLLQLSQQQQQQQQITQDTILLKDACYWALAAGYNSLCEFLDFETLFRDVLLHELHIAHPAYKIIRRRVAHVLESWVVAVAQKPTLQNAIFRAFSRLFYR
jgi:hypothetical protein